MQDFSEKRINKSIFVNDCEVYKGKFSPYIHPNEATNIISCENRHRKNIITCKDEKLQLFLDEVNGLDFNVRLYSSIKDLPSYIPVLDYTTAQTITLPDEIEVVGITLPDIIKTGFKQKAGRLHITGKISYHEAFPIIENLRKKKLIIFMTGEDTIIEEVWHKRSSGFFASLASFKPYIVSGFNFSLFGGECAFSHALNQKRSLYSSYLFEKNSLTTMPHVYALSDYHIKRWITWFQNNPHISIFTTNCQMQKSKEDINSVVNVTKKILTELPYLHVILQGFHLDKLKAFGNLINRIHLAEKKPVKYAIGYKNLQDENVTKQIAEGIKKMIKLKMATANILFRKKCLDELIIKTSAE